MAKSSNLARVSHCYDETLFLHPQSSIFRFPGRDTLWSVAWERFLLWKAHFTRELLRNIVVHFALRNLLPSWCFPSHQSLYEVRIDIVSWIKCRKWREQVGKRVFTLFRKWSIFRSASYIPLYLTAMLATIRRIVDKEIKRYADGQDRVGNGRCSLIEFRRATLDKSFPRDGC